MNSIQQQKIINEALQLKVSSEESIKSPTTNYLPQTLQEEEKEEETTTISEKPKSTVIETKIETEKEAEETEDVIEPTIAAVEVPVVQTKQKYNKKKKGRK